ncbi:molybdopterin-guanine dinucleotide biosynthesis protein B [Thalassobacillus sp. B23F22_16]|uniref:molybdopterin-guanine dinucleotide biosynthesis protein B n=1 Tax=Thalassobacillus sp. B23F22_16 TaxID=3459513 RepID=UPI00373FB059
MPDSQSFPIIQVIGFKNSGKTTMMNRLIRYASEQGLRTASLKHHGHSDNLEPMHAGTDSFQHQESGAFLTGVEGGGSLQLEFGKGLDVSLKQLINIYENFSPNLLLIEGYKREVYPKILMARTKEDFELVHQIANIRAVVCWEKDMEPSVDVPVFYIETIEEHLGELIYLCKEV